MTGPDSGGEALHEFQCPSCGATTRARMADATTVPDNAGLRARVQRILGHRVGAPAIQLTADLFRAGEGPLAALLAERDKAVAQVEAVRAVAADFDDGDIWGTATHPGHVVRRIILKALGDA